MRCEEIEADLSGYIDGELNQQRNQQIALHLETCLDCKKIVSELELARREAASLGIEEPTPREWKNMERHIVPEISRSLGWTIVVVWSAFTAGYGAYQLAVSPNEPLLGKVLIFSIFFGFGLIFLSILLERMRESRTDRYKGVHR